MNKSKGFVIYNRQNHDVPLSARQKWANDLEYIGILSVVADFDRFERREAQLRRKWERQNRAADAA